MSVNRIHRASMDPPGKPLRGFPSRFSACEKIAEVGDETSGVSWKYAAEVGPPAPPWRRCASSEGCSEPASSARLARKARYAANFGITPLAAGSSALDSAIGQHS